MRIRNFATLLVTWLALTLALSAWAADRYVAASGTQTGVCDTWATAANTLEAAISTACTSAMVAGDRLIIDKTFAQSENAAARTYTLPGTITNPNIMVSATNTGSAVVPADVAAGASYTSTGTSTLAIAGSYYCYGVSFTVGTGSGTSTLTLASNGGATALYVVHDNCHLSLGGTGSGNLTIGPNVLGQTTQTVRLLNTNLGVANAAATIVLRGNMDFEWNGGSLIGVAATSAIGSASTNTKSGGVIRNIDMSLLGASKFIIAVDRIQGSGGLYFANIKTSASIGGLTSGSFGTAAATFPVCFTNTGSSGISYNLTCTSWTGTLTSNTSVTCPTAPNNGVDSYSWNVVTTANASRLIPFITPAMRLRVASGSKTVTVPIVTDGITLKDIEAYLLIQAKEDASFPIAVPLQQVRGANVPNMLETTGTSIATVTNDCTGVPGTPVKQNLVSASLPFGLTGELSVRVAFTKPSIVANKLWVSPLPIAQ